MPKIVVERPGHAALVAGGFCAPCVAEEMQAQTAAVQKRWQINAEVAYETDVPWEGVLAYEDLATGDGRYLNAGSLRWDGEELPLRWAPTDEGAHKGAALVGMIQTIERRGNEIYATGFIDTTSEYGSRAYALMAKGMLKGVSVDLDEMDVELRVRAREISEEEPEVDENGYMKVGEGAMDDEMMYVTDALLRAATLVDIPAFKGAYVKLAGVPGQENNVPALVAAAPVRPSEALFQNPGLREPTPITITDDGHIFGHAALWGTCHTGFANTCVTPPRSANNYAWFRTGDLVTAEGTHIPVGKITMSTGHANTRLSAAPAAAHYDDTGVVAADVAAGEDKHGIWISGALRSTLTEEQLRELRASPMSGDWRQVGGHLEMVALLAVNLPGFPVPRTRALVASGGVTTCLLSPVEFPESAKNAGLDHITQVIRRAKVASLMKTIKE